MTDDTAASADRASLDYAHVGHLPGRCTHCGFHSQTQEHRGGCDRRAPVTPQERSPKRSTESGDSDFIDNVRRQDAAEAARQRAITPVQRPRRAANAGDARSALRGVTQAVASKAKGDRNAITNWSAYKMREHVQHGSLTIYEVRDALLEANRVNGHLADDGESMVVGTIASGLGIDKADLL